MIDTLESVHGRALRDARSPLEWTVKKWWQATSLPPFSAIQAGTTIGSVPAEVNQGRWVVQCPDLDCPCAILASDTDRRFVCPYCGAGVFAVDWPADHAAIEASLLERPVKDTRNWTAGESVDDLAAENERYLAARRTVD